MTESHRLYDHTPVWAFCDPKYALPFAPGVASKPLFEEIPPHAALQDVANTTGLAVFIGAFHSEELDFFLQRAEMQIILFDPSPERANAFTSGLREASCKARLHVAAGRPAEFKKSFASYFPKDLFDAGFPAIHIPAADENTIDTEYIASITERIEFLFYRYRIHPLATHPNRRGLPWRPMTRGLFFDQIKHLYENIPEYLYSNDLRRLRKSFVGAAALVVAAGPDAAQKIDLIRTASDSALIIAVNNALPLLLKHGIEPHFAVVQDNTLKVADALAQLPRLERTVLVGHCLGSLGKDRFRHKYIFDSHLRDVFGLRPNLRHYGSVLTSAYSLARFLGCSTSVLVGAQLASQDPFRLGYAPGTIHYADSTPAPSRLPGRFPQLYPVHTPHGRTVYTTPNFRDTSLWFLEEIRLNSMKCVNTSPDSILFGPGIRLEENPELPADASLPDRFAQILSFSPQPPSTEALQAAQEFIRNKIEFWNDVRERTKHLLSASPEEAAAKFPALLEHLDTINVSYLVQRFEDFDYGLFHERYFASQDQEVKLRGIRKYLHSVQRMAEYLSDLLHQAGFKMKRG